MQPEYTGSIFTSINPLTNQERFAIWVWKRGPFPLWFNHWRYAWKN